MPCNYPGGVSGLESGSSQRGDLLLPLSLDPDLNKGYCVELSHWFALFLKEKFLLGRNLQFCSTVGKVRQRAQER